MTRLVTARALPEEGPVRTKFFALLFPKRAVKHYLRALSELQNDLGWRNHMVVAGGLLKSLGEGGSAGIERRFASPRRSPIRESLMPHDQRSSAALERETCIRPSRKAADTPHSKRRAGAPPHSASIIFQFYDCVDVMSWYEPNDQCASVASSLAAFAKTGREHTVAAHFPKPDKTLKGANRNRI